MKRYKRILICIDRPDHDGRMLEYAGRTSRLTESEETHCLHVVADAGSGSNAAAQGSPTPPDMIRKSLQDLAEKHFRGHGKEKFLFEVVAGSPLIETLRYAHDKDIDLIIMGRHYGRQVDTDDEALLARRITRKATCSVLVLPEDYQLQADAFIVPVRDSECSANALEIACGIAATTGATVTALNVFHVGAGYSNVGTNLQEHQALLEAAAGREYDRLLSRVDTHGVTVDSCCVPDLHGKPIPIILETLGDGSGKAVVIGARGRTGAAGVLLGTVTEQLIRSSPSPVLAVKKKGECIGILRALLAVAGQG